MYLERDLRFSEMIMGWILTLEAPCKPEKADNENKSSGMEAIGLPGRWSSRHGVFGGREEWRLRVHDVRSRGTGTGAAYIKSDADKFLMHEDDGSAFSFQPQSILGLLLQGCSARTNPFGIAAVTFHSNLICSHPTPRLSYSSTNLHAPLPGA